MLILFPLSFFQKRYFTKRKKNRVLFIYSFQEFSTDNTENEPDAGPSVVAATSENGSKQRKGTKKDKTTNPFQRYQPYKKNS
ncbi:MAG: hypothetical protein AB2693_31735 [Candidatus Thiodiazotropha sp.]